MNSVQNVIRLIVVVIAILLQLVVAPYIVIGSAEPNFLAVGALCVALAYPYRQSFVLSFVLGLLFDLFGGGPLGAMALTLVVVNVLSVFAIRRIGNDTLFMGYVILLIALLCTEAMYGLLLLGFGYEASFGAVLLWRVLPNTLYDFVIGLVVLPIMRHFSQKYERNSAIPTANVGVGGQ